MVGSVKSMVVGFVLAAAVSCASLLGVALTAQRAEAASGGSLDSIGTGDLDEKSVEEAIDNFFKSTIGGHVKKILSLTGIVIVLFTLVKNFGNAVKNGAGVMTVLPSVLVGCLAGGVLMSPTSTAKFLGWIMEMMSDTSGTITDLVG